MDPCGNDELLAGFIDRSLSQKESELFENHLSSCTRCLGELVAVSEELGALERAGIDAPDSPPGRAGARQALLQGGSRAVLVKMFASLSAALVLAAVFTAYLVSPATDFQRHRARENLLSMLNIADVGELRLSGGRDMPESLNASTRGPAAQDPAIMRSTRRILSGLKQRYPHDPEVMKLLGHYYMAIGFPATAEVHFREAADIRGDDPETLSDLSVALFRQGKTSDALSLLEKAGETGEKCPECLYNLAVINKQLGNYSRSLAYAREYLLLDPDSPWADRLRTICGLQDRAQKTS